MFPIIYRKLKQIVTRISKQLRLFDETPKSGRPSKINKIDAVSLALYQHQSTRSTKKSIYEDFKDVLKCSYKTLVVSMNKVAMICLQLLFILMDFNKQHSHLVKYTDATDIPVCLKKNADDHKTMRELSGFGRSTKGWFYGLKMTMTRDCDGKLLALRFTKPSANDRDIFRDVNHDIFGIIGADAGYVSKQLENDMSIEHKRLLLIRPYKNMKKLMTQWQLRIYQGRFKIEFDFRSLKMFHGLVTSLPRSVNGYLANYIHALTSFVLS
ncbi:MAG: hypothetical protein A3B86_01195 [Candidatus Yanofskybacteria bacterium RIFCSPHIGHO2_02_FULL_38_22b]|uniref:Transposase DDE domain-containing protein n=1 Tax=Candidatus Yanofskybacteria bacterium RIFCSPHIGHO2_02_FULL_38_22b TaxID=1802673 RepID=A0A1F8F430_9BACT|nr:MAG: hypothetical protein A3B86_01195 [Candidatus Yanofskybacteria bacterium RIFCSPHIGHO2_02_FULL_38_22b]OGN20405.1 MAG: hypothetical protein A2910_01545 [Candidatus Yanofskybacteria bacterium RIFCSPLOWO2_01_FULL_39_28]